MRYFVVSLFLLTSLLQAGVTGLKAEFRKGKTFVTWKEISDTTVQYKIFRSSTPILTVAGLNPVAAIPSKSGFDKRYGFYHIITDSGAPLDTGTGLFVYTPKVNGNFYYAVTVTYGSVDSTGIVAGENATTVAAPEEFWKWPAGVMRSHTTPYSEFWMFYYWMDYDDWPHNYDYYGDLFQVSLINTKRGQKNLPIYTGLHGYSGVDAYNQPSGYVDFGYSLNLKDNSVPGEDVNHTWWYGVSNNYQKHPFQKGDTIIDYTAMRYVNYLHAVKQDKRFSIDTTRVYLGGQSMGGGGTLLIGCHYPGLFAAFAPTIGRMNYPESMFAERWGAVTLGLTARNGVQIYKWNNVGWILEYMRHVEMAPVIDMSGSKDNLHPFYTHSYFFDVMQKHHQGVWGRWLNIGHENGQYGRTVPGGGMLRFKLNEMFPAFSNATVGNSNYGKVTQSDSFNIAIAPTNFVCDSAGWMNCQIDWSSSLHRLSYAGDSLIDSNDSLRILFTSTLLDTPAVPIESLRVDITPRRLQKFKGFPGALIDWKNIDVATNTVIESGRIAADSLSIMTVPQFLVKKTGNRLLMTKAGGTDTEKNGAAKIAIICAAPNPFTPEVTISVSGQTNGTVKVRDISGRLIETIMLKGGKAAWKAEGLPSGIYFAEWNSGNKVQRIRLVLSR
ncbi:MAG: T9SS type A sorting domain-containing protein [Fibrobacteres bacterium]|nr:T9SS type A sorting domain-containing protein [Fibrobacterota bacterium]